MFINKMFVTICLVKERIIINSIVTTVTPGTYIVLVFKHDIINVCMVECDDILYFVYTYVSILLMVTNVE